MMKEGNNRDYDFDNHWRSMESWIRKHTFSLLNLLSTEIKFPNFLFCHIDFLSCYLTSPPFLIDCLLLDVK
jgi:hypothetical protein